jgi:hypothetical protein
MITEKRHKTIRVGVFLAMLMLLSACAFSPERAATDAVKRMAINSTKALSTLRVLQAAPWREGQVLLVYYEDEMWPPSPEVPPTALHQLYLFHMVPGGMAWEVASSSGMGWGEGALAPSVFSVGLGVIGQRGLELSAVYGQVFDERVTALEVAWADGEKQRVEVVGGSYLALRDGSQGMVEVLGLNADGEVVHTFEW